MTQLAIETTLQTFDSTLTGELFLFARLVFGGVLAFMGLNHFLDVDAMAGYAEAKGVPAPRLAVVVSGGMLVFGGLGVAAGVVPAVAAGALALFLLVTTPKMHDFWNAPEDQVQDEMTAFLKNVGLFAASVGFLAVAAVEWPYAAGVTLL
jgi:putative oxidoreductase